MSLLGNIIPPSQTAGYLRTLPAIRERCGRVHELAKLGKLEYFEYHPEKEIDVAKFCIDLIKVCICIFNALHPSAEVDRGITVTISPKYVDNQLTTWRRNTT